MVAWRGLLLAVALKKTKPSGHGSVAWAPASRSPKNLPLPSPPPLDQDVVSERDRLQAELAHQARAHETERASAAQDMAGLEAQLQALQQQALAAADQLQALFAALPAAAGSGAEPWPGGEVGLGELQLLKLASDDSLFSLPAADQAATGGYMDFL